MLINRAYNVDELNKITGSTISFFQEQLKDKYLGQKDKFLLPANEFRYLHEYEKFDGIKGGILIVWLNLFINQNENGGVLETKQKLEYNYDINKDNNRNSSNLLFDKYPYSVSSP